MLGLNPEGRTQNSLSNYGEVLERGGREGGTEGRMLERKGMSERMGANSGSLTC